MEYYTLYPSPVGTLLLTSEEAHLTGLWLNRPASRQQLRQDDHPVLVQTAAWLDAYFRGEAPPVTVPLAPRGTEFQQQVWQILRTIPYGGLHSYGHIARELAAVRGKEKMSAQAVGQAVGKNPISILIPCHRVVGARGQLTGYGGGLENKIFLLRHEGHHMENDTVL